MGRNRTRCKLISDSVIQFLLSGTEGQAGTLISIRILFFKIILLIDKKKSK